MDPLSVTASVITVGQAAGMLIGAVAFYASTLKNASELELPKLKREIEDLQTLRDVWGRWQTKQRGRLGPKISCQH
ncbi:hypothetical protein AJ79_03615 [Helicocarpus griseus UAMH5409]|uniref:Uncharacterized protein n=1 Tax=Helicocarpus griseus UAMH5409 TaxID=1447875 RepID=A0A2B7XX20_9EURO|nr:hypothetical protein AJ79_03615 [Helicocarpus griseus UAMH5409]